MKKIQLSIPEPCHENWDHMTPTQQGRFCNACAKQVIDFSEMSDSEVLNYFSKVKNEKVCGRAYPDQLDRTIAPLPTKKIYWYWNYAIALFLLLAKSTGSKAQSRKGMIVPKPVGAVNLQAPKSPAAKQFIIHDFVADEHGQPISFASIRLLNSTAGVIADENGKFTLTIDQLNSTIEVSALNYETKQVVIYNESAREIVLTRSSELMKEVVINAGSSIKGSIRCTRTAGGIAVTRIDERRSLKDTLQQWISDFKPSLKVYPNPVAHGNTFIISMKLNQPGNYTLQVTDAAGRRLVAKKITALSKEHKEQLPGNNWSAGIYYVKVTDEKAKPAGTATFSIQ
jgi:hypothetical protein